jgi:hypothetical protein
MENALLTVVTFACLGVELWALVDCLTRRTDAFPAVGKLSKAAWIAITAIGAFLTFYFGVLSLGIIGVIAALVYLLDVRPAVKQITGGSNRW